MARACFSFGVSAMVLADLSAAAVVVSSNLSATAAGVSNVQSISNDSIRMAMLCILIRLLFVWIIYYYVLLRL